MKRQIKLRAWIEQHNRMAYGATIDSVNSSWVLTLCEAYDIPPMQFTGLIDKKGNEIWEGDIFTTSFGKGRGEIFYNNERAMFMIRWHSPRYVQIRRKEEPIFDNHEITMEVIGNIHEHKNIL